MTDPVARAARRQNTIDRIAEHLTEWGCPPDLAHTRAAGLLHTVESHGWAMPAIPIPPVRGPGSTPAGRTAAWWIFLNTRAGCTCGTPYLPLPAAGHLDGCPTRRTAAPEGPASTAAGAQDALKPPSGHTETPQASPTPPSAAEGVAS